MTFPPQGQPAQDPTGRQPACRGRRHIRNHHPTDRPTAATGSGRPPPAPPTGPPPDQNVEGAPPPSRRWWAGDPLSVILVLVIVSALALGGLLAGEIYARHKADTIVAKAVSCVVQDGASASFGMRPMLLQVMTKTFNGISVQTAGNRIREAKGMKLDLHLDDVHLNQTVDSAGTLGALDAEVSWSSDGIKETAQGIIPVLGDLISDVSTNPSSGIIELVGPSAAWRSNRGWTTESCRCR